MTRIEEDLSQLNYARDELENWVVAQQDERLFQDLARRSLSLPEPASLVSPYGTIAFRNREIAPLADPGLLYSQTINLLEAKLQEKGGLTINTRRETLRRKGKPDEILTLVAATDSGKGEMTDCLWIRDQTQIVKAWMDMWTTDHSRYHREGEDARNVLLSLLTLMSTPAQIGRFQNIIAHYNDPKYLNDSHHYPHIFLHFDNLDGKKTENWAHKQDAWQMLVVATFEALEKGLINIDDLKGEHRQFLSLALPFLDAIKYWQREDSGSWEEIEALRASTLAWNISVIEKIREYAGKEGFEFLSDYYEVKRSKTQTASKEALWKTASEILARGMKQLAKMVPFEAPLYPRDDPRFRQADMALIYLLQLDMPAKLARRMYPAGLDEEQFDKYRRHLETMLLKQILSLADPATNGFNRYHGNYGDSYQREGYWTNQRQAALGKMYQGIGPTGDFSGNDRFSGRHKLFPAGRRAAWTHPNFQLSSWAGRRYQETHDAYYLHLQREFLLRGLSMNTAVNDISIKLSNTGITIDQSKGFHAPECYVTLTDKDSISHIVTGPFTPLNWTTALLHKSLVDMEKTLDTFTLQE